MSALILAKWEYVFMLFAQMMWRILDGAILIVILHFHLKGGLRGACWFSDESFFVKTIRSQLFISEL